MTAINSIEVQVVTGNVKNAGTDQPVYLVIGDHAFALASSANDFERGSSRTYVLGKGATISNAGDNDPRHLTLEELNTASVRLRIGEAHPAAAQQATEPSHGGIADALNRATSAVSGAGAALNRGLNQAAALPVGGFLSSPNWNLEEVTVTVHPASGSPVVWRALQGPDNAWIGGHGQPNEVPLTRSDS